MNLPVLMFFVCGLLAVVGSIMLIWAQEPIHSALSLIMVMVALALLYVLLGAEFVAAVQIFVYAGAIMVLFVFVVMLLNAGTEERTNWSRIALPIGVTLAVVLIFFLSYWLGRSEIGAAASTGPTTQGISSRDISTAIFRQYLFPFEATSILILIAVLGAWILGRRDQ
jgi:NADH-quinone oxidoreductase subunit J